MIRKTLTILSLVGLVVSVGVWIVSYPHYVFYASADCQCSILILEGVAMLTAYLGNVPTDVDVSDMLWELSMYNYMPIDRFPQFQKLPGEPDLQAGGSLNIPLYLPVVLCAVSPTCWLVACHRRRKRRRLGLCIQCGYDLRGSAESCPECSSPIEKP